MQTSRVVALSLVAVATPVAQGAAADPMGKVFEMLNELKGKIVGEGEAAAKTYKKFFDWCDDESSEKRNEISTATAKKADLEGLITEKTSDGEASKAKIEELAATISQDSKELTEATAIRGKEHEDFTANEADLIATIDTLSRAIGVIEKGGAAAFAQMDTSTTEKSLAALRTIVDAASFNVADKQRLLGLVQQKQSSDEDDDDVNAPAAVGYQKKSGGVVDLLEDLKEDAEEQLSNLRKAETASAHNFAKLKQSLTDSVAADTQASDEEKASMAASAEAVATAQGELDSTVKALQESTHALETAHSDCIQAAADHEKSVTARAEELGVLEQAKKILKEATGGASFEQSYSLLQVSAGARSTMRTRADLAHSEVAAIVKQLAKTHHSAALAQLASRISAAVRYSAKTGADPFAKIKTLIQGLITKLEEEGAAAATEEAYCQEQMAKTEFKKAELEEDVEKLTTKIDQATSKSASLKEEANTLQAELAALVKQQTEMDQIRSEEHDNYVAATTELKAGLGGVRKALELLRDYYGSSASASLVQVADSETQPSPPVNHGKSSEAGGSIINILEVCESDFASGLSKEEMEEATAESDYQAMTQENKMTKMSKEQDVKYKLQASTKLDKAVSDMQSDLASEKDELSAVLQYYGEVKDRCIAKPDPYEAQKAKRDAEIKGLKEALSVLESETAFVQRRKHVSKHLRH